MMKLRELLDHLPVILPGHCLRLAMVCQLQQEWPQVAHQLHWCWYLPLQYQYPLEAHLVLCARVHLYFLHHQQWLYLQVFILLIQELGVGIQVPATLDDEARGGGVEVAGVMIAVHMSEVTVVVVEDLVGVMALVGVVAVTGVVVTVTEDVVIPIPHQW